MRKVSLSLAFLIALLFHNSECQEKERHDIIYVERYNTSEPINCTICEEGTFSPKDECFECNFLGYCPTGLCLPCQKGSFSNKKGSWECVECDLGFFQPSEGKTNCTSCPPGTYTPIQGSEECTKCDYGTIAPNKESWNCTKCDPGFTSTEPFEKCTACGQGTFCPIYGCRECEKCQQGYYQNQLGQSQCLPCQPGTYSNVNGSNVCITCGPGKYSSVRASTTPLDCQPCPAGYYCPDAINSSPLQCPSNAFCPTGCVTPQYCLKFFVPRQDVTQEGCIPSKYLYMGIGGILITCFFFIFIAFVYNKTKSEKEMDKKIQEEATKLLKTEEPVYNGL